MKFESLHLICTIASSCGSRQNSCHLPALLRATSADDRSPSRCGRIRLQLVERLRDLLVWFLPMRFPKAGYLGSFISILGQRPASAYQVIFTGHLVQSQITHPAASISGSDASGARSAWIAMATMRVALVTATKML